MTLVVKKLDKKKFIKNIIKIMNMSKIRYWNYNNYIKNLPSKWEKSLGVFDKIKNQIIAYCIVSQKKDTLHIHLLMVSEKYQGIGVGSKILKNIMAGTSKKITVKTYTNFRKTINFYLKNKFKIHKVNKKTILMIKKNF